MIPGSWLLSVLRLRKIIANSIKAKVRYTNQYISAICGKLKYFINKPPIIGPIKRPSPEATGLRVDTEFTRSPYSDSGTDGLV